MMETRWFCSGFAVWQWNVLLLRDQNVRFPGNIQFQFQVTRICFVNVIKRHVILDRLVIQCLSRGMLP